MPGQRPALADLSGLLVTAWSAQSRGPELVSPEAAAPAGFHLPVGAAFCAQRPGGLGEAPARSL